MTVKIHTFTWVAVPKLRIKAGQLLGHLYSDKNDDNELHRAAKKLNLLQSWFQSGKTLHHYDIWGSKLVSALKLYEEVGFNEFGDYVGNLRKSKK